MAVGTLIPIAFSSLVILYPAACRRVGLPVRVAMTRAVLPAVWPSVLVGAMLVFTRPMAPPGLAAVAVQGVLAGLLYFALFLFAIGSRERAVYAANVQDLLSRRLVSVG